PERYQVRFVKPDGTRTDLQPPSLSCCAVSPDGKALALRRSDRWIVLWDLASREERPIFQVPRNRSFRILLSCGAQKVAYYTFVDPANRQRLVHVMDLATGKETSVLQHLHSSQDSWDLQLSPDGRFLMTREVGERSLSVWNLGGQD